MRCVDPAGSPHLLLLTKNGAAEEVLSLQLKGYTDFFIFMEDCEDCGLET